MNFKRDKDNFDKSFYARKQAKTLCKCGRKVTIIPTVDSQICSWCGRKVKNTSIARFRYLLSNERNKLNENI